MKTPTISIVMPVYNGEEYLKEAIDSILNQTYTDFEFIILNDGSTDKTEEIILSYGDPRIVYIKNEQNLQIVKTLNKGILRAKGKYIARMDADDISLPKRFEKQLHFMEENSNIDICGSWLETFGDYNQIWKPPSQHNKIKVNLLFNSAIMHPTIFAKRTFFSDLKYNESMVGAEDYELWVRSIDMYHFSNIPFVLLKYRIHSSKTDKNTQIDIANLCRKKMLKKCGCSLSDDEFDIFLKISFRENVDLEKFLPVLNKILYSNKRSNYFNQKLLSQSFIERFFYIAKKKNNYNLKLLFTFHNLKTLRFIPYPLLSIQYIKFSIKCLLRRNLS